ncbi:envelope integrity protein Cei [Saccharopolyspora oryzae]|uniref:Envelope integrity protein Cei n=1 Tax=Saccharopolyspora oryzae TaxID=2997343 RepID=A0ABT4UUP5_9PSEU|nr:envelope integrity protein Cei [Saccharopolyspora oryzae]MDA3625399.1 envelope integrity protein Cei [Saccharopolyspora oryzae]
MAAVGARGGRRAGYRRRRPLPALLVLACLVVAAGFLWTRVFDSVQGIEAATTCAPPTPPTAAPAGEPMPEQVPLGTMLERDALNSTNPIPPQDVQVRVLNGNGESRQATLVGDELASLGFAKGGADNDPVYVNYDLKCHGQIRFGGAGVSAARTLSLIAPCAQLVRDERPDATIDFALGKKFKDIKTTSEAKQVLQELENWVPQRDQQGGAHQEVSPPQISKDLLEKARDVHC